VATHRRRTSPRRLAFAALLGLAIGLVAVVGIVAMFIAMNAFRDPVAGDVDAARSSQPGVRILFVGNSLTSKNDLPGMVSRLAGGLDPPRTVITVSYTRLGARLSDAAGSDRLARLIASAPWDYVVLQELSVIPSWAPSYRAEAMDAPVAKLAQEIRDAGATPVFYATWAYPHGDPGVEGDSFDDMTARVLEGYRRQADRTGGVVVPVAAAWAQEVLRDHGDDLLVGDDRHPSRAGTYLAAATFVAQLLEPSSASRFTAGLPRDRADELQRAAGLAVGSEPAGP
jgi:hypothetical protein